MDRGSHTSLQIYIYIYIYTYKYLYETFPTDILNHVIQIYSLVDDSVY